MGSLSSVLPIKSRTDTKIHSSTNKPRSKFLFLKKIDYLQWVSVLAVFIFFMFLVQLFLPLDKVDIGKDEVGQFEFDSLVSEIVGGLDFGEDLKFGVGPTKFSMKFQRAGNVNVSRSGVRFGNRKVKLGMVFADLLVDSHQVLMVSVAAGLREIGYEFEVYSLEDGPAHFIWETMGVPVNIIEAKDNAEIAIDWLNYDGVLVNSLAAKDVISSLLQEPFRSVPLIWTVHEKALATRAAKYISSGQVDMINDWKAIFNRATVVVFPNYVLPMFYAAFDAENHFVVPGYPSGACKIDYSTIIHEENLRVNINIGVEDFVVGIVESEFLYKGIWLEHAFVLKALLPLLAKFPVGDSSSRRLKIIVLSQDSTGNYSAAMEEIASNLNYPMGTVKHVAIDEDSGVLDIMDLVIYGSFLEEQSFPDILLRAMCLSKPIIAPDLSIIKKHISYNFSNFDICCQTSIKRLHLNFICL